MLTTQFVDILQPLDGPLYDDVIIIPHDCLNDDYIRVGQFFFSRHDLLVKLSMLVLGNNFNYNVKKSTKSLLTVRCFMEECKWRVRATKMDEIDSFEVKKYSSEHTCSLKLRLSNHRQAKSSVFKVEIEENLYFKYVFMALGLCIQRFLN